MPERTLILTFFAGLIPTAAVSLYMLYRLRSRCKALEGERDAWKRACDEMEKGRALPCAGGGELEEAVIRQMAHIARIEEELAQLRREHGKLQAVLVREKERIGRIVRDLKLVRGTWINSRRLLAEASSDRTSA